MRDEYKFHWLKECLDYNPDTGVLTWKERDIWMFPSERYSKTYHNQFCGKEAGSSNGRAKPYRSISCSIFGKSFTALAHRVAWYIHTGQMPNHIDHINGDTMDNRIVNLRSGTNKENCRNQKISRTNTSGVTGVTWRQKLNKWEARIRVDGKRIYLGVFEDLQSAAAARKQAEKKYGFHENHGRAA